MPLKHKTILTVSAALSLAFGGLATAPIAAAEAVFTPIPQAQMKAVWTDSVETGGEGANGPLEKVLDGDSKSYWHTVWYQGTGNNEMPHKFIIDLGKEVPDLGRVILTPRQSSNGSGRVREYEIVSYTDANCADKTKAKDLAPAKTLATGEFEENHGDLSAKNIDFAPAPARCVGVIYKSAWGGQAGSSETVGSLAEFNAATVSGYQPPAPPAAEPEVKIPNPGDKITITDGTLSADLQAGFPQVIAYHLQGKTLPANVGPALKQVRINEQMRTVSLVSAATKTGDSATYKLKVGGLEATLTVKISLAKGNLRWEVTAIDDPKNQVDRLAVPGLNLVSVAAAKDGSLTVAGDGTNRMENPDTTWKIAKQKVGHASGYMAALSNSELAAGLVSNAVSDDYAASKQDGRGATRWVATTAQEEAATAGKTTMVGSLTPASWVVWGTNTRSGKIGKDANPFAQVRVVSDVNGDSAVDWQDSATATRALMVENKLPNGYGDTKNRVITRIPFNIVSQATHPFLRTLDDTKRISLETDNLGQHVLLKGYQAEGHDSAQGDYAGHYNQRAGGFTDLVTMTKGAENYNADFGVHINATESYSEAKCFNDGTNPATVTDESCVIKMPPQAAWGWMNQAYYMDDNADLAQGRVIKRFQKFRDELTEAGIADRFDWLYFDVFYGRGWRPQRLGAELQKQGWEIGSEWAWAFPDTSLWSHWANDEKYGGYKEKGLNSTLIRFVENSWRDSWNPNPLLGNANVVEFEGWTGHTDYDKFINNVWQRNLPTKFLQQSDIKTYQLGQKATFTNGTEVTSKRASIGGTDLGTDRVITYDGATVYTGGKYLLPWGEKDGIGAAKSAGDKLYHYNPAGGTSTWTLPGHFKSVDSFHLYELTATGRVDKGTVNASGGSISLSAKANTAYVLYPQNAPSQADPNWGQGSGIKDPGFFSGTLKSYETSGNVSIETSNRGNFQALIGEGASSLSQTLTLPKGDYSMWAWVEVQPGQERQVDVSISGNGVKAVGNQKTIDGKVTTRITKSTAPNKTASDEKFQTYFQRVRVTFHSEGDPVTFQVAAGDGTAKVRVDDLRVVKYSAPVDNKKTAQTVFFDDFEDVDTGYWPFVTGATQGGDARTQLAERHSPYSDAGWWGKNKQGQVVAHGKQSDNVLAGKWSLLAHEENAGQILRTIPAAIKFEPGHKYRVSFAYQQAYAGEYQFSLGRDWLVDSQVKSSTVQTKDIPEAKGKGVGGKGTQIFSTEFVTSTVGDYWIGINKVGGLPGSDLTLDNIRVEDLGKAEVLPGNADPAIQAAQTVSEGQTFTVQTNTEFFEPGNPGKITNLKTTLSAPDGWKVTKKSEPSGDNIAQNWEVKAPQGATDGVLTYKVSYQVDSDGTTREVSVARKVKVLRSVRDGVNYLSDLPWSNEENGWGPVERDQENGEQGRGDGTPIKVGGKEYPKGIGAHAPSSITFDLAGKCTRMNAIAGVDDTQQNGSVKFMVIGDGKILFESPQVVTKAGGANKIDLDITGVKSLILKVTDGGNGVGNDHADWADAKVTCKVETPAAQPPSLKDVVAEAKPGTVATSDAPTFVDEDGDTVTPPAGVKFSFANLDSQRHLVQSREAVKANGDIYIDSATGQVTYLPLAVEAGKSVKIPIQASYPQGDKTVTIPGTVTFNVAANEEKPEEITEVTPIAPVATDPGSCEKKPFVEIPVTKGVKYLLDGKEVAAGKHEYAYGKQITVTAQVSDTSSYRFAAGAVTKWTFQAMAPEGCEATPGNPDKDKPGTGKPGTTDRPVAPPTDNPVKPGKSNNAGTGNNTANSRGGNLTRTGAYGGAFALAALILIVAGSRIRNRRLES